MGLYSRGGVINPSRTGSAVALTDLSKTNSVVLFGDSRVAQCGWAPSVTSMTSSGTTVTVNHNTHRISIGQTILVGAAAGDEDYTGLQTVSGITDANNFTFEVATAPANATATNPVYTRFDSKGDKGFFTWANALMGQRFNILANLGLSGDTVSDMASRVGTVLSYKPKYCVVMGGFNSIYANATAAEIIADLTSIYNTLIANGITVIAVTDTPLNSSYAGGSGYSAAYQQVLLAMNAFIRDYCTLNEGAILIDAYRVIVDPTSATGQPQAAYTNSDYVHLTPSGAKAIGTEFNTVLGNIVPYSDSLVSSVIDNYDFDATNSNIILNGMMAGTGGSAVGATAGTVADNWSLDIGNVGTSVTGTGGVARSDGYGYDQQIVAVSTADNQICSFYTSVSFHGRITVDRNIYFECEVDCSSLTNFEGIYPYLSLTIDGNVTRLDAMLPDQTQTYDNTDMTITVRTDPIPLPAGSVMTACTAWVKFYFSGAGGGTFKVGRAAIRNI